MTVAYSPALEVSDSPASSPTDRPFSGGGGGGGGAPTLADLDSIVLGHNSTLGWLSDVRMPDQVYSDYAGTTNVTTTGDLAPHVKNQSAASGSGSWYSAYNSTSQMYQWIENKGLTSQNLFTFGRLQNVGINPTYDTADGFTTVLALRWPSFPTTNGFVLANNFDVNDWAMNLYDDPANSNDYRINPVLDNSFSEFRYFTPPANDICVLIMQTKTDGQNPVDPSCAGQLFLNNTQIGADMDWQFHIVGDTLDGLMPYMNFRNRNAALDWNVLGSAMIFGSLTESERQTFVDYFQANDGVLA